MTATLRFDINLRKGRFSYIWFTASTMWWWEIAFYKGGFHFQLGFIGLEVWYG